MAHAAGRPRPAATETRFCVNATSCGPTRSAAAAASSRRDRGGARTKTATEEEPAEESDEGVEAVPETDAPAAESSPAELPAAAHRTGTEATLDLSDRRIPVLTLGVGLALVGLGIGFLGVRMRRR
jgi:hypothetical protein